MLTWTGLTSFVIWLFHGFCGCLLQKLWSVLVLQFYSAIYLWVWSIFHNEIESFAWRSELHCFLSDYICCKGTLHPSISLFSIVWILFHKPLPLRWVDPFFSETKKGFTTAHVSNPNVDIGLGVWSYKVNEYGIIHVEYVVVSSISKNWYPSFGVKVQLSLALQNNDWSRIKTNLKQSNISCFLQ